MKKIILIQPIVGDWDTVRTSPSLPLALLCISRYLTEYEVQIIDQRIDKQWQSTLVNNLSDNVVCVGITSMTGSQISHALLASRIVKQHSPIPVIWGGVHASLVPEQTLQNENIDIVVVGEGEVTFYETVKALDNNIPLSSVNGIYYKSPNIQSTPPRPFTDLNIMPPVPYNLVNLNDYTPLFSNRPTLYIQTSRGCVNRCAYCYNPVFNKRKWRSLSAEKTIEMLKHLIETYGITSFYIVDDDFFVDVKRAELICRGIIDNKWDIIWESQGITINTASRLSDDQLSLIEQAGCKKVHFGIESGSEKVLDVIHKNISINRVHEVVNKFKKHNIICQYNFMAGFPDETDDDIKQTIQSALWIIDNSDNAIISPICTYTPYPGTELYDRAIQNGYQQFTTLEQWSESDYGNPPWTSESRNILLKNLFFTSLFLHGSRNMIFSPTLKFMADIYKPIARYRLRHFYFGFMIETLIKKLII